MYEVPMWLAGKPVDAQNNRSYQVRNPISGDVVTTAAAASVADARAAADAAATAFPIWSQKTPGERRTVLLKAADNLAALADEAGQRVMAEMGGTGMWGGFNIHLASSMLREAAGMTTQIDGAIIPSDEAGMMAMGMRQPVGVVLGIAPWNAPIILGVRSVAMPLACGNSVVFKASEICPATHQLIAQALIEAGLPDGTLNMVTNAPEDAPEIVKALIEHPAVRRVNFTGSTRVGRIIAGLCADNLKPALLELGGKAPMVVLDDADVDAAVNAAAFGAYMNQGQICMSTERLIVTPGIADKLVTKLAEKARTITAGKPEAGNTILGSVVNEAALERLNRLIDDAARKGAEVLAGGRSDSVLMDATLLDQVTSSMQIYSEESFGPVLSVLRAQDEEDAIRLANDSRYGLSAAVFSRDFNRALAVAGRIDSGICHINSPTVQDQAQMPFGGVKDSGYGRFGSKAAIDEFTELRWITNQMSERHYPF
ncbi:salicylaldehyde dehydrogenase [Saccharospirillum sp. MSK14-1]|uniref:aldehyde dehydrogenase n=1 Tax=Saccharospirillum sp. MSK14-1 TaxID=1897632 RepID=UPI000D3B9FEE|nr:aldehyde dehydrogenase [Saccharospirillum sp. MSK14-1]PTY38487.1 salicylaldehyde dehydrogenase [Saccharospirillum sp. MSK14-1]